VTQDVRSDPGGLVPGDQLAGYQIEEQIGRGGMAVVYRALDLRLGRAVALKVLAPHLGEDEAFRQRFIRESRAAAGVDHPHIVPVFEAGEADGVLFIAMRYVEYGDVRSLLDTEGRLDPSRACEIAAQVAAALDTAHAYGLVHRDVKPGNILLGRASNDADHVYLSDFGLSKHSLAPSTLTSTGQFLGTLDYVSPEQIQGHPVDGRADEYALACTVVEMLTGSPPFRHDDSMAIMWAQLESEPPRLTQRRPDLPPAVDDVIAAAMAKMPDSRYPTCRDFALALKVACTGPVRPRTAQAQFPARWPETQAAQGPYASPNTALPRNGLPRNGLPQQAFPQPAVPPRAHPQPALPSARQWPSGLTADPLADGDHGSPWQMPPGGSSWASAPPSGGPAAGAVAPVGQTAYDVQQPFGRGLERAGGVNDPQRFPAAKADATWSALPDTRTPAYSRRHSQRGRGLALATVLVLACLIGAAGIAYALSHRHNGAPPAASAHVPPARRAKPAFVVREYFSAINHHRYLLAYQLSNRSESFATFKAGFAGTAFDAVTIKRVAGDVVTAKLIATQADGTDKIYEGTYTVINGAISSSDIQQLN
jgi:serine/threonine protein kinase